MMKKEDTDLAFPIDYTSQCFCLMTRLADALDAHASEGRAKDGDFDLLHETRVLASEIRQNG